MSGSNSDSIPPLTPLHIFMVSFPGQGHVNPLLRLANDLASKGHLLTFSTFENFGKQMRKANINTNNNYHHPTKVGLGSIQFDFLDDGLEENDQRLLDFNWYIPHLELMGRQKLPELIKNQEQKGFPPVCCIIHSSFIPWASDVAESFNIPSAVLWVQSCACFSAYYHYYNSIVPFPSEKEPELDVKIPFMPLMKYDEVPSLLHPSTPYGTFREVILSQYQNLSKPFCILMDTVQELEDDLIEYMSKFFNIKPIGPLFKISASSSSRIRGDIVQADSVIEFLDSKPQSSVVYISFGSIVHLKQEQIDEIAHALLSSKVSFLWVMRPPSLNRIEHVLPKGFLEEVGDKGTIVKWSNQEEVLEHKSVACFFTHCGWNSTMEAVANGVPLLLFPQWGDQVTNAKFLEDVFEVGIRLWRGEPEGRIVERHEIEKCLLEATRGPKAEEMKRNALKWKTTAEEAVAEGGSSSKNMQDFMDELNLKIKR
ncbi:transferase [Lithospermum erythrorhizon]|uniref:Glycosyltransferase n=1 Tax=Lithospermum erythrorhizon TaxID=34254 RepID=A0AAV3QJ39_LITER